MISANYSDSKKYEMKQFLISTSSMLVLFTGSAQAFGQTCTKGSEDCLQVTSWTKQTKYNTEYHWTMHNLCDASIDVIYKQHGSPDNFEMSNMVPPYGEKNANGGGFTVMDKEKGYYDFHIKGCPPPHNNTETQPATPQATPTQNAPDVDTSFCDKLPFADQKIECAVACKKDANACEQWKKLAPQTTTPIPTPDHRMFLHLGNASKMVG
jgi:hypothetical protein